MKILGIDYGEKKSGIAFAEGPLADPVKVLYHEDEEEFIVQLIRVVEELQPEQIVVGLPTGTQGEKVKMVIERIKHSIARPVITVDEQFSTLEAQLMSREAGIKRKKRKSLEDAYSASIILQKHLDSL